MSNLNQLSNTFNTCILYVQEQSGKHSLPPRLTTLTSKMMLAANAFFNFGSAAASRIISAVSQGKYLNGKAAIFFAQAQTDCAKAGTAGLAGFTLSLVLLVTFYKKISGNPTKTNTSTENINTETSKIINNKEQKVINPKELYPCGSYNMPYGTVKMLESLFEGSCYDPNQLPSTVVYKHYNHDQTPYKHALEKIPQHKSSGASPERKYMKKNTEHGLYFAQVPRFHEDKKPSKEEPSSGSFYIIFKVDCTITEENRERLGGKNLTNKLENVIIIGNKNNTLEWSQLNYNEPTSPLFIKEVFTSSEDGSVLSSAQEDFDNLKKLIKTGEAKDSRGLIWRLENNDVIVKS